MNYSTNEISNCTICKNSLENSPKKVLLKDPFKKVIDDFSMTQCANCSGFVLNPRPELSEMGYFYDFGFLFNPVDVKHKQSLVGRIAQKIQTFNLISESSWIKKHLPKKGAHLDYSAGNGQILSEVAKSVKEVDFYATEFSNEYLEMLRSYPFVKKVAKTVEEIGLDQKYDLISLFGVLEHVEDPSTLISTLKNQLNDGGKMIVAVPNVEAWQKSIFKEKWYNWLAPRHWQMFTYKNLVNFLKEHDLSVVDNKHFFLRSNSGSIVCSLFPSLDPLINKNPIKMIAYASLFYAFIPFEIVAALFKKSGFMGVVVQKNK